MKTAAKSMSGRAPSMSIARDNIKKQTLADLGKIPQSKAESLAEQQLILTSREEEVELSN